MKYNIKANRKLLVVLVLVIAVPLTVYLTIKGIEYLTRGAASTVNVTFSQSSLSLDPNATNPTTLNILANTNTSQIGFVRAEFTFDPAKLMLASEIIPTNVFKKVIKQTSMEEANSTGRVSLVLGLDPADRGTPPTGPIQLATVSLKAKAGSSGSTTLTFDNSKMQIVDMTAVENTITSTNTSIAITSTTEPTATATSAAVPTLNISMKFQGINNQGQAKIPTITFKEGTTSIYSTNNYQLTSNASGVYSGNVSIPQNLIGTYDVYIKDTTYLQKKFANISLVNGANTKDFTASPLKAGDFNNSNTITINDISLILSKYTALSIPVDTTTRQYDINNDGALTILDISLVLSNYTALSVPGE